MNNKYNNLRGMRKGVALIVAMIFLAIFGALAVAMSSMSRTNVQAATNQAKAGRALASAESGLDIMRYAMQQVVIPGRTFPDQIVSETRKDIVSALAGFEVGSITLDATTVTVPAITLNSVTGQSFTARIVRVDAETVYLYVTGMAGDITRTVRVRYDFVRRGHSVFDFGVATRGPLMLQGNVSVEGVTVSSDADVYIESLANNTALEMIGRCSIDGRVRIVNPNAVPSLSSQARIGGASGPAVWNHITIGVPPTEFPEPDPKEFLSYATGPVIRPGDPLPATLTNAVIAPGVNPKFTGNMTINGILYIQQPNIVDFGGTVNITGLIVGEGDYDNPSLNNQLIFRGNVNSRGVADLPNEPWFSDIRTRTGTFCLAPGFRISMGGNFGTINGAIAASGVEFFGDAGGTVRGSVINYSQDAMTLSGNSDILFNRSGITEMPAGFVPEIILRYDAGSYVELVL
ncbi:MAG TPA: pilus assembly PilX N-terminal domain-containing protein [Sedimentisphaerales bacterium]|nr:pilus assembly PilX N-terminal domain-containing protein [Sedimentisphaerales bacterium]